MLSLIIGRKIAKGFGNAVDLEAAEKIREGCASLRESYDRAVAGQGNGIVSLFEFPTLLERFLELLLGVLVVVFFVLIMSMFARGFETKILLLTVLAGLFFGGVIFLIVKSFSYYALDMRNKRVIYVNNFMSQQKITVVANFRDLLMVAVDGRELQSKRDDLWVYRLVLVKKNSQRIPISKEITSEENLLDFANFVTMAIGCSLGEGKRKARPRIFGIKIGI